MAKIKAPKPPKAPKAPAGGGNEVPQAPAGKEKFLDKMGRYAMYGQLYGNDEANMTMGQRIGGAAFSAIQDATLGQMGTLGKAMSAGISARGKKTGAMGGSGVVDTSEIPFQQIKGDEAVPAINQSTRQIVAGLNSINNTLGRGFNGLNDRLQAQGQSLESIVASNEDVAIGMREMLEALNKMGYDRGGKGNANESTLAGRGGGGGGGPESATPGGGSSLLGDILQGAAIQGGLSLLGKGFSKLKGGAGKVLKLMGIGGAAKETAEVVGKETAEAGGKVVAKEGAEAAGKTVLKEGAEVAGKTAAKSVGKGLLKSALKKIPGIGLLMGIGFGIGRLMKGDILGAAGEVASGAVSTIPGVGTAASLAIDAGLMARDLSEADATKQETEPVTPGDEALKDASKNPEDINITDEDSPKTELEKNDEKVREIAKRMGLELGEKYDAKLAGGIPEEINGIKVPDEIYTDEERKKIESVREMRKWFPQDTGTTTEPTIPSSELTPSATLPSSDVTPISSVTPGGEESGATLKAPGTSEEKLKQQEKASEADQKKQLASDMFVNAKELSFKADKITFETDVLEFKFNEKKETQGGAPEAPAAPSAAPEAPAAPSAAPEAPATPSGASPATPGGAPGAPPAGIGPGNMPAPSGASPATPGGGQTGSLGPGGASTPREQAVLDMIAKREGVSGDAGFDMILGDKKGKPGTSILGAPPKPISQMTLRELYNWQTQMLNNPNNRWNSSAVGSGQFVRRTLFGKDGKGGLIAQMGITPDQWDSIKFDKAFQQKLTLMNFRQNVGDPNADPSKWNMKGLMNQWESFDTRKGFASLSSDEIGSVRSASTEPMQQTASADASQMPSDSSTSPGADASQAPVSPSTNAPEAVGGEQGTQQGANQGQNAAKVIEAYGGHRPGRPEQRIINLAQQAATKAGMPSVTLTSGKGNWISPAGRAKGQKTTMHSTGLAVDIGSGSFKSPEQKHSFISAAKSGGAGGVGVYKDGSVHIDFGKDRSWNWGDPDQQGFQNALNAGASGATPSVGGGDMATAPGAAPGSDATPVAAGGGGDIGSSGGMPSLEGLGGGNPLASMLGGGGSPFGMASMLLGPIIGSMSKHASLSAASPKMGPATTNIINNNTNATDTSGTGFPQPGAPQPAVSSMFAKLFDGSAMFG